MNDLKFAFRQLLKNPGFTAVAVLTLALGIGANTAIFSVIYGVLLKPLPYRDPEQLIRGKAGSATGEAFAGLGVMPPGVQPVGGDYRSMAYGETVDFWWPVTLRPQDNRGSHYLNAVGRLKPGVQPVQASADLNVIAERLAHQFPDTNGAFRIALEALREAIAGRARTTLLVVFGAVFLVL